MFIVNVHSIVFPRSETNPCGWKPQSARIILSMFSLKELLLTHVERAVALGIDEAVLSVKIH